MHQTLQIEVASIRDAAKMKKIFSLNKPNFVFHAAAYKHVPLMETFTSEAVLTNIFGSKLIADLSAAYGVRKFVMVSTDKAVNPTNVMGATKRISEIYIQSLCDRKEIGTEYITTRFGNVLGSAGSVVATFKKQINAGGPITVTHPDITRYFMTIPEASKLVLEAGKIGETGDILLFDMGSPVKIIDFAKKMIQLSRAETRGYSDRAHRVCARAKKCMRNCLKILKNLQKLITQEYLEPKNPQIQMPNSNLYWRNSRKQRFLITMRLFLIF